MIYPRNIFGRMVEMVIVEGELKIYFLNCFSFYDVKSRHHYIEKKSNVLQNPIVVFLVYGYISLSLPSYLRV